jgi:hypothetical protein
MTDQTPEPESRCEQCQHLWASHLLGRMNPCSECPCQAYLPPLRATASHSDEGLRAALAEILEQFNRDNIRPGQAAFNMADIARRALAATPTASPTPKCGCTIHDDRGEPCQSIDALCVPCWSQCWGVPLAATSPATARDDRPAILHDLIEATWGGYTRPADDAGILLAIADWMDRLDDVADGVAGKPLVSRAMQDDLRRIAAALVDEYTATLRPEPLHPVARFIRDVRRSIRDPE